MIFIGSNKDAGTSQLFDPGRNTVHSFTTSCKLDLKVKPQNTVLWSQEMSHLLLTTAGYFIPLASVIGASIFMMCYTTRSLFFIKTR